MDFNLREIDNKILHDRAVEECEKIKENKSFKLSGRSYADLLFRAKQGQAAEVFLMEHCGYDNDDREYHDVVDPNEDPVEVKVVGKEEYVESNIEKWAYDKSNNPWKDWPEILMVWINDGRDLDYKYYGKYIWKDGNWRKNV